MLLNEDELHQTLNRWIQSALGCLGCDGVVFSIRRSTGLCSVFVVFIGNVTALEEDIVLGLRFITPVIPLESRLVLELLVEVSESIVERAVAAHG
jgi:hypothetical protein